MVLENDAVACMVVGGGAGMCVSQFFAEEWWLDYEYAPLETASQYLWAAHRAMRAALPFGLIFVPLGLLGGLCLALLAGVIGVVA